MPLFVFYPCNADGSSETFVTQQLKSDADAAEWALKVLNEHARSAYVAVWQDDRPVLAKHRLRPGGGLNVS